MMRSERHTNTDQRLLLAAAQAGDEQAFHRLVDPYRRALQVHCYRMLGSAHDAEDLVQETLLRAWRALERFEPRAQLQTCPDQTPGGPMTSPSPHINRIARGARDLRAHRR